MTFKEFINQYEGTYSCKDKVNTTDFDHDLVSFKEFLELYHRAVRAGITPDNAAEVFIKRFNTEFEFELDAKEEGLSLTDRDCSTTDRCPNTVWA